MALDLEEAIQLYCLLQSQFLCNIGNPVPIMCYSRDTIKYYRKIRLTAFQEFPVRMRISHEQIVRVGESED